MQDEPDLDFPTLSFPLQGKKHSVCHDHNYRTLKGGERGILEGGRDDSVVKCLLCTQEGLIGSQNPGRKLGVVAHASHPSVGRWGQALLAGQSSLINDTQDPMRDIASKNKVDGS